jgi:hypothetical protein
MRQPPPVSLPVATGYINASHVKFAFGKVVLIGAYNQVELSLVVSAPKNCTE